MPFRMTLHSGRSWAFRCFWPESLAGIGATGAFGVSLFFVLSSYLITELLLREKDLIGTLDVRSFYIRRILRIWPLYFAFLALAVVLQWIVPGQHVTWRAGMWFSLLAGNWFIVFHGFPSSVIFPLWSVSIEEQFYITWPAVVRRVSENGILICAGLLLSVATIARVYLGMHHTGESDVWCNTFVQLDPIAIGNSAGRAAEGRGTEPLEAGARRHAGGGNHRPGAGRPLLRNQERPDHDHAHCAGVSVGCDRRGTDCCCRCCATAISAPTACWFISGAFRTGCTSSTCWVC